MNECVKERRKKLKEVRKRKAQQNNEGGITLVSLAITIVILIILAAVTINITLREGGLVEQAQHAAEQTVNSTKTEQEQLDDVASQINDIIAGIGSDGSNTNSIGGEDTNQVGDTNTVDTNSVDINSVDTNSVDETNTVDTNTIEPGPEPLPDNTITIGEPQWQTDSTANVTVSTTEEGVTIEYKLGGTEEESWIPVEGGIITGIENGETVYVRITDGEQASNPQEKKVEDTTAPENANIEIKPASVLVGESLTATVTHVDSGIGVDVENSKWVLTESADAIGTSDGETSKYTGKFTTNPETIALDSSNAGTYYLHVLTVDKAGNKTETVSGAITINAITGTVSKNGDESWNAGKATLVLQSSETAGSQLKIVYKINGEGEWQEYNGTSITGLSHGDKVTACLTNASQTTFGPEANFEIKDEIAPTVTVTAQGSPTTNSITVTAQASDNKSGMKDSPTYTFQYKVSEQGSYTTPSGAENISNAQYTFTGLTQGTSYDIQVIVNGDNAGNTGTGTLTNQTTATVPGADEGLVTGSITASPVVWSNYKASTTLTTTTNFKIQYQVNGTAEGGWSEAANSPVTVSSLDHGNTVYARLTDGVNAGSYAAINVMDKIKPVINDITTNNITYTDISITVVASDGQTGLADINTYRYYINNESVPRATSTSNKYTFNNLTAGTKYEVKVIVEDKAGNTGEKSIDITTNSDTTAPLATIRLDNTDIEVGKSVIATVSQTDNGSGINISECKWVLNTSSSNRLNESQFTGKFTTATNDKLTLTARNEGTYYLHVLTTDNAGNKTQTISKPINFINYITFTVKTWNGSTSLQFKAPKGITWSQYIKNYGGSSQGFRINPSQYWVEYEGSPLYNSTYGNIRQNEEIKNGAIYLLN